eukprot:229323-Prymnesium_polylepis.1
MLVVVSGRLGQIGGDEGSDPDGGRQLRIDRAYAKRNDVAGGDFILPEVYPRLVGVKAQVGLKVGRAPHQPVRARITLKARLHLCRVPVEKEGAVFWL